MNTALLLCGCLLGAAQPAPVATPEDSVVKLLVTVRYPNPLKPWLRGAPADVLGSGTIIDGRRILTNAHLVQYATEVQIQPRRGGGKVDARVEFLAPEMDLALLSVRQEGFFDRHPALPRSQKLPRVQDNVAVYGFPVGGNDLAVTRGVVSRIEVASFGQQGHGLTVQVSAAVNPGNSGGPAVVGGKMVGVVYSRLSEQQNIGYILPNAEIDLFLEDVKDGHYDGKPTDTAGTTYQRGENRALRRFLKLDDEARGLLVVPPRRPPAGYPFQEFDFLTKIGPHDIDNDGMIQLPDDLRVSFLSVVGRLAKNGAVPVTLIRKGQRLEASLPVSNVDNRLIRNLRGENPSYFIHGPLVFSPAKLEPVALYSRFRPDLEGVQSPLYTRMTDRVQFPGEELVVVASPLFAHKIARGYDEPMGQVVKEVNGTRVRNLRHLVELLRDSTEEYLVFRFAETGSESLVFRREELNQVTAEILEDNGISPIRRGSEEFMKVWEQPGSGKTPPGQPGK
jgi:S1-C subfamily serine protease